MLLKFARVFVVGLLASFVLTIAVAAAGVFFRLDIGPPIAAGVAKTKDGLFAVRALACDEARDVRMMGTAEGIVNGQRQSVALKLAAIPTTRADCGIPRDERSAAPARAGSRSGSGRPFGTTVTASSPKCRRKNAAVCSLFAMMRSLNIAKARAAAGSLQR